jgi:endonuclease YncB( thermonuclease family)
MEPFLPCPRPAAVAVMAVVLAFWSGPLEAARRETLKGPIDATVLEVLDGDTLIADAHVWPGQTIRVSVRVRGIDAPELKSRCAGEHVAALEARKAFASLVAAGRIRLTNIGGGKYYGRVLADVENVDGAPIGPALLSRNLVRAYHGGRRQGWCG